MQNKKGLWIILKPITFEISIAMILSAISTISIIVSLTLLAFILSNIFKNTPMDLLKYLLQGKIMKEIKY